MQFRNSANSYGAVAKGFHWLTAALVILAWALGSFDDVLPKGPARAAGLFVHMSAGLTIIAALAARLLWRLAARLLWRLADAPPLPEPSALGVWLDRAGRLAHIALYALLAAVPVAGIVLQFARGDALPLFGFTEIPSPWIADRAFARSAKEVHELLANALVILAGLHAAAALLHHWLLKDRTLVRMLPDFKR